jgi:ubiquinone/menaquinone biosynthesis C-methylase UbiE
MNNHASWSETLSYLADAGSRAYDEVLVPCVFEPWARLLVDELEIAAGETVLDVACGPGTVARVLAARVGSSGRVVACDLSDAMLAIALGKPPVAGVV